MFNFFQDPSFIICLRIYFFKRWYFQESKQNEQTDICSDKTLPPTLWPPAIQVS